MILVLLFTFRSGGLPVLLIVVIQGSIWINFSFPTLTNTPLYFLGYLIVQAIQMGANIDYAIVISSHYQECKATVPHKEAIVHAVSSAFPTVFTSGSIMASAGLLIGGISAQGVIDAAANLLAKAGGGNVFVLYTFVVWGSVLISAFIDNIPYVATMIPVIGGLAAALNIDPTVLYFGLLSGATLGGNCTPIGASANITGIGILRKEGYTVKNSDFFKIGIPFTLAAIIPAYAYLWLIFGM